MGASLLRLLVGGGCMLLVNILLANTTKEIQMSCGIKNALGNNVKNLPFSFVYGGKSSRDILKDWEFTKDVEKIDDVRKLYTFTFKDPVTGLEVIYKATEYLDFPAVEWVLNLKNHGKADSPILENVQALDVNITKKAENKDCEYILYHSLGSLASKSDFTPIKDILRPLQSKKISSYGGRSSDDGGHSGMGKGGSFPFFDIAYDKEGVIFAVGWSGQWAAEFKRDAAKSLNVIAGMELTHLKLHLGEEIRMPSILMFSWKGDRLKAHNDFRRFILKYHTPQQDGKPVQCPVAANSWFKYNYGSGTTEKNQIDFINMFVKNKIDLEYYWLDAGWYENDGADSWVRVGNWFPKEKAFPNRLKPVADHARKNGMGFVLWLEPERVSPGTWLFREHPEWLFMPKDKIENGLQGALLNLGNPDARQWLTDHVSAMIKENGIGIYRQDFNFPPLGFWRAADAPDRQGISEIRYIEGLYAFWDELRKRHPDLIIDNCASGGRRIDLETISRSVALWRSDYFFEPEGAQSHTIGLSQYIPSTAVGCNSTDPYIFRSHLSAGISLCWDPERKDFNAEEARQRIKEFKLLRPLFYGNFYPLTTHSLSSDVWCAYQLNRKDLNLGAILVFHRKESPYSVANFKLYDLNNDEHYEFTDIDSNIKNEFTGKFLIDNGFEIKMPTPASSRIIIYKKIKQGQ